MDYFIEHAKEIMYLCFGGGFLVLVIFAVRALWIATHLLAKLDDLSELFIEYIQKPLRIILQLHEVFKNVTRWFKK
ncbi:hypothetical protein K9M59_03785 [Candidatus Gracilibacteria bacterium]|nr:hypothetical protein [Candidatus Gracilibacteria bacterium]MCF7819444.1 hypothetical protein [Candidatus Gracilibacteria bacterium]